MYASRTSQSKFEYKHYEKSLSLCHVFKFRNYSDTATDSDAMEGDLSFAVLARKDCVYVYNDCSVVC